MPNPAIQLLPIRMGELVKQYVPPNKRDKEVKNIDFSEANFPSFGNGQGQKLPAIASESLSDKIKEQIRLEELNKKLLNKEPETDISKMTKEQLAAAGWVTLRFSDARNAKLGSDLEKSYEEYYKKAPLGMSYEDYIHFLRN